jgi:hypothetical protein
MPLDNFTLVKVRALKDCPQGQRPGDVFDLTSDAAAVLVSVGDVELVDDPTDTKIKGHYKRRDLRAEP